MKREELNSKFWKSLIEEIVKTFAPGVLIPHEWLHRKLGIEDFKDPKIEDYESLGALVAAVKRAEIDYMALIEILRRLLLEGLCGYLANIHREGYMILPPDEQVSYAFRKFMKALEKNISKTDLIMKYTPPVSTEQRAIDRNHIANYDWIKQGVYMRKAKIQL